MKKLIKVIKYAYKILKSDQHCIMIVKGNHFYLDADMDLDNFKYIAKDSIENTLGPYKALWEAEKIINQTL